MRPRLHVASAATCALLTAALPLCAQRPGMLELFGSRKELPTDPLFGGLSLTALSGPFGFRIGGGLHLDHADRGGGQPQPDQQCWRRCWSGGGYYGYRSGLYGTDPFGVHLGGWTVDADLLFAPFRTVPVARSLLLGFSPYVFAGIGGMGSRPSGAPDTSHATLSYGLGIQHDLLGWLGLSAEGRYRRSLGSDSALSISARRSWEYRVGLTVSFGGSYRSSAAAGTPPSIPSPEITAPERPLSPEEAARTAARILDRADGLVGAPYRDGGDSPESGFDAAGFVRYVFGREGVSLPRTADDMAREGREVSTRVGSLRPGDLLFFANDGSHVDHVAIYVGRDRVIHASASAGAVRYDVLGEGDRGTWFADHLVTARRVLGER